MWQNSIHLCTCSQDNLWLNLKQVHKENLMRAENH